MAKTTMKEISINFTEKEKLTEFIDLLSDTSKEVDLILQYKPGSIKVRLFGDKDDVFETVSRIKTTSKMFLESIRKNEKGFYTHHLSLIQRTTKRIIALEILSSILNRLGYETYLEGHKIISTINIDELIAILDKSFEMLPELETIKSKPLRKILLTVSYVTEKSINSVIGYGLEKGYFREYKNKILVTLDTELCITKLIEEIPHLVLEEKVKFAEQKDNNSEFSTIQDRLGKIVFEKEE